MYLNKLKRTRYYRSLLADARLSWLRSQGDAPSNASSVKLCGLISLSTNFLSQEKTGSSSIDQINGAKSAKMGVRHFAASQNTERSMSQQFQSNDSPKFNPHWRIYDSTYHIEWAATRTSLMEGSGNKYLSM